MPNKKKPWPEYILPYKTEVAKIFDFTDVTDFDKNVPLHPNSSYYQMYLYNSIISIIQKSDIIIINIMRQPNPVSWFEISLRACRNAHIFFYI